MGYYGAGPRPESAGEGGDSGKGLALKNLGVRIPLHLWRRASHRAVDENSSLTEVVVKALEAYLRDHPPSTDLDHDEDDA